MFYPTSKRESAMDAKSLLDSLMGASRNQDLKEQKKNKGNNFKADSVCKHYLVGFCPSQELAETKLSRVKGGQPMNECKLTHSDAMKSEFEAHSDHKKLCIEYERSLLSALDKLVRDADSLASKERDTVKKNEVEVPGSTQMKKMPQSTELEISRLTKDMNKLMAAAEENAEKGDVDGSKFKVTLAEEIKSKIDELKADYVRPISKYRGEEVCEVCGQRLEAFDPKNPSRHEAHFTGLVHNSYIKIRDWFKTLKKKPEHSDFRGSGSSSADQQGKSERVDREQDRDRLRDRDRGRDADGDGRDSRRSRSRGDRERSRVERDRVRDRDRFEERDRYRNHDRGGDRDRFRDRGYRDRAGDRGNGHSRDRSRSRRRG